MPFVNNPQFNLSGRNTMKCAKIPQEKTFSSSAAYQVRQNCETYGKLKGEVVRA